MISERRNFVLRFQQLTGPVMAKGLEDTAFFRYFPLASLNEVGGEPAQFGVTSEDFHRRNRQRMQDRPHGLSATSTHDTKRSEDVRARLNVLSEMPAKWYRAVLRWRKLNHPYKTSIEGIEAPDANDTPGAVQATVVVTEFAFEPTDLQVPAGTPVEIVLENRGVVEHDLTIDELGIEIYAGPGETVTETVTIPAGTYEVYCSIPGHHEAGMHATLTAS